jgi:type VI protein secretion system component Hcp
MDMGKLCCRSENRGAIVGNARVRIFCVMLIVTVRALSPSNAAASSVFINIPGISGETPTPGFPDALATQSITISSSGFSVVRQVDAASTQIANAVALGTTFSGASALFYDTTPVSAPDATLTFQNVVASSYQLLGGMPLERDGFNSTTQYSMFLQLPGITGDGSSPGPAGSMVLQSFTLDGQHFSVFRPVDSATPALATAVLAGTVFPSATVFFFDPSNSNSPVATLVFENVLASSIMIDSMPPPEETDDFVYTSLAAEQGPPATGVPEPSPALMFSVGAAWLGYVVRRRSSKVHRSPSD